MSKIDQVLALCRSDPAGRKWLKAHEAFKVLRKYIGNISGCALDKDDHMQLCTEAAKVYDLLEAASSCLWVISSIVERRQEKAAFVSGVLGVSGKGKKAAPKGKARKVASHA